MRLLSTLPAPLRRAGPRAGGWRSASYLAMEIYAGFKPDKSQTLVARFRTWIESHTDQVIIWGGLVVGLWLVANSIYLIVT